MSDGDTVMTPTAADITPKSFVPSVGIAVSGGIQTPSRPSAVVLSVQDSKLLGTPTFLPQSTAAAAAAAVVTPITVTGVGGTDFSLLYRLSPPRSLVATPTPSLPPTQPPLVQRRSAFRTVLPKSDLSRSATAVAMKPGAVAVAARRSVLNQLSPPLLLEATAALLSPPALTVVGGGGGGGAVVTALTIPPDSTPQPAIQVMC